MADVLKILCDRVSSHITYSYKYFKYKLMGITTTVHKNWLKKCINGDEGDVGLEPHIWTQKYAETDQQISYGNYRDGAVGQKLGEYGRENAQNHPPETESRHGFLSSLPMVIPSPRRPWTKITPINWPKNKQVNSREHILHCWRIHPWLTHEKVSH
jgi:hypothetical protein